MNTLTIRELINAVKNCGIKKEDGSYKAIMFDFCTAIPTNFDSWRGSYDLLALNYKLTGRDNHEGLQEMRANDFIDMCEKTIGKEFTGYKGGEYVMNEHTAVWIDNYGAYTETGLVGVKSDDYCIYLKTAKIEY